MDYILDTSGSVGFQGLHRRALEIAERCREYMDCRKMAFRDPGRLSFDSVQGHRDDPVSSFAFGQLCQKIGVPSGYMESCNSTGRGGLVEENVNSWLSGYERPLLVREYNGVVRGILSARYCKFDAPDVFDVLGDVVDMSAYDVKGWFLNEEFMHFRLVGRERMDVEGEDLFPGLSVTSSDVGMSSLKVSYFVYKQVCTNGLVVPREFGMPFVQRHVGLGIRDFREGLRSSLASYSECVSRVSAAIRRTREAKLDRFYKSDEKRSSLLSFVRNMAGLSVTDADEVLRMLSEGRYGRDRWGLINAVTDVAQRLPLLRRLDVEGKAGSLLLAA